MNRLNYYPLPKPQESAMSLIFRCAKGNGISTLHLLRDTSIDGQRVKRANALWQGFGPCELLTGHEDFTSMEKDAIRSCFYKPTRLGSHPSVEVAGMTFLLPLLRQHLSLCPGCARDGYLNNLHIFSFSEYCPVHGERYITHCPSCGKPLIWTAISDYICPCKYDLRNTLTVALNTQTPKLINNAVVQKDDQFFTLLLASIVAMRFLHTVDNRIIIIDHCARIATGNKSLFFREMDRIQEQFPSLHRRAILAPFILSESLTLSDYAMEYLFQSSQTRPLSHPFYCQCWELSYTGKELDFILDTHNIIQTWNVNLPLKTLSLLKSELRSEQRYQCHDLCKVLYSHKKVRWENEDLPGEPGENFEILGLTAAADFLDTNTSTVRALIVSGLLKGHSISYPNGLKTSLEAIRKFSKKYVLRSEIVRRSGLSGQSLKKLLAGFAPIAISVTRYGRNLLIYHRKHLSEGLRLQLEKKDLAFLQSPLPANGMVTFKTAKTRLNLAIKDVTALRDAGILLTAPFLGKDKRTVSERCTPEGLQRALEWRKQHLSVAELAKASGYGVRTIHIRYLDTGAVSYIELQSFFISIESAKFILNHLKSYTTWLDLCYATGISSLSIEGYIEKKLLTPLPSDHPDAINGLILFKADEARQFAAGYQSKRFRISRKSEPCRATARRPEPDTSLTTSERLEAIVRTCCFSLKSGRL